LENGTGILSVKPSKKGTFPRGVLTFNCLWEEGNKSLLLTFEESFLTSFFLLKDGNSKLKIENKKGPLYLTICSYDDFEISTANTEKGKRGLLGRVKK
jgi:hypothetical protein